MLLCRPIRRPRTSAHAGASCTRATPKCSSRQAPTALRRHRASSVCVSLLAIRPRCRTSGPGCSASWPHGVPAERARPRPEPLARESKVHLRFRHAPSCPEPAQSRRRVRENKDRRLRLDARPPVLSRWRGARMSPVLRGIYRRFVRVASAYHKECVAASAQRVRRALRSPLALPLRRFLRAGARARCCSRPCAPNSVPQRPRGRR